MPTTSLQPYLVGNGRLDPIEGGWRLGVEGATRNRYSDSQLDDFHGLARTDYLWQPPVTLSLQARFSHPAHELKGTAGFGWWNNPFVGDRTAISFVGPRALWFFLASPPGNLGLTGVGTGQGWFAQSLNMPSIVHFAGALGLLLFRFPRIKRVVQRAATRLTRATEQPLDAIDITAWHDYRIHWQPTVADFYVDDALMMTAPHPPTAPLALVLWRDNQWATMRGRSGLLAVETPQWMELRHITVK